MDHDSDPEMLPADDALEELPSDGDDGDVAMDSDDEGAVEVTLQNDSIAYFDQHRDSVFVVAQHPTVPTLIATGGSEGEGDDAPGKGYVVDTSAAAGRPVLPASYSSDPAAGTRPSSEGLESVFAIDGHTDSINSLAFTLPSGRFLVSGGMDGRLRAYAVAVSGQNYRFRFVAEAQEVPEINWIQPCPSTDHPDTVAIGASDGSVWVFAVDPSDEANPLQIVQSYFLHTEASTAGAWTPDGSLLATVSEDASLYVWDVWGLAAAKGLAGDNGMTAVSLTAADQRFVVEGGLFSVAVEPRGTYLAVGGQDGHIRIVSLPRLAGPAAPAAQSRSARRHGPPKTAEATPGGQILAALHNQSGGVESLSFSTPAAGQGGAGATTLLAAGSVDGSVVVFDASRGFAVRRVLPGAHDQHSVVKVEFVPGTWLLTTCGMDGVVRRWDLRGATATAAGASGAAGAAAPSVGGGSGPAAAGEGAAVEAGLVREWMGHSGGGEGGGVLGFVQGETGERIVTAGDDGLVLVFEA